MPSDDSAFVRDLKARVRGEVHVDPVRLGVYATDASIYQIRPRAVLLPLDADDVEAALTTAVEHGVSVLPRGGGTSLAGQTVGESLVLDFTKHMNRVLEVDLERRWASVQPGLVRDQLNERLEAHGLYFAPDPATTSRATFGGMLGNNSAGVRSIRYGKSVDHTLGVEVLLADGTRLDLEECSPAEVRARAGRESREGDIYRGVRAIVEAHRGVIETRYPKVMRRVGGYNLDELRAGEPWNLAKLMVGSEGTLATMLSCRVNLEPLPRYTTVFVAHFAELLEAVGAVAPIVAHAPSAVEILDATVVQLARRNLSTAPLCDFLEGDPAAVLIVELYGDSQVESDARAAAVIADLKGQGLGYSYPIRSDRAGKSRVWSVRKNGLGLMLGKKGPKKPLAFIEDAAVPVEVLAEYIADVLRICAEHETEAAMYAHASVGLIHVRPLLDLRQAEDIARMRKIANATFERVVHYGGSWSGEHGDGIVRSGYLERFFGAELYGAFRELKSLFDPAGLMNPGKIVDPLPMDQNLRFDQAYESPSFVTEYQFVDDGTFAAAVEMCSGVGACRQTLAGAMCPSYRATRDEEHSTRGRANALRLAMTGQYGDGADALVGDAVAEILDLCLACKACKSECPSNVDLARLKGEVLQRRWDATGAPLADRLVAGTARRAARSAGWKAPLVNAVQGMPPVRWALERFAGVDRRRPLPRFATVPLARRLRGVLGDGTGGEPGVVLFDDTFTRYYEPEIGVSAVTLLQGCGLSVGLAGAGCCQRPRLSKGFLRDAKRGGERTLRALDAHISAGLDIVVLEPSCASALTDDLPDLVGDAGLSERIRGHVMLLELYLERELEAGRIAVTLEAVEDGGSPRRVLAHGHCHQKALYGTADLLALLGRVEGLEASEIAAGCCGMAGSFGYEPSHYDISRTIGEDRLFPTIREVGEETIVVAPGFSCRHQIRDFTGVRARHWVEVVRVR